jgi:hypothetical protein
MMRPVNWICGHQALDCGILGAGVRAVSWLKPDLATQGVPGDGHNDRGPTRKVGRVA